ncbi:MAG: hypothetical protein RIC14_01625 [Filomicrobium sp.]
MNDLWAPDQDVTPNPHEVENMAATLEAQHGQMAAKIADFFSSFHGQQGDAGRSWAWAGVAQLVRKRERERLSPSS